MNRALNFALLSILWVLVLTGSVAASPAPWEKPRDISAFQSLLQHSPFSLPTAEETSPLSDRYALTGIVTIGDEEQVFVFDRTDQSRNLLTHTPNSNNMSLVSLVRDGDAPAQKATIRVGANTGTIGYLEAAPQQANPMPLAVPGNPGIRLPPLPQLPQQPGVMGPPQPGAFNPRTRRIIRRPMVNPPVQSPTQ